MRRRTFLVGIAAALGCGRTAEDAMAETLKRVTLRVEGMT
jgi:hypothetical protein